MYTAKPAFVVKQVTAYDPGLPEIHEPQKQMSWSDSYEMYGEKKSRPRSDDLSEYWNYSKFKAKCKLCDALTQAFVDSNNAVKAHFLHCAQEHGYVHPVDERLLIRVSDEQLQEIIKASSKYDLPMPGYDKHTHCIKQYEDSKLVCIAHEGNFTIQLDQQWMGWY